MEHLRPRAARRAALTARVGSAAFVAILVAACGGDSRARDAVPDIPPRAVAPGDTLELDRWNLEEVVVRLEEAGLAVQRTGEVITGPQLQQEGTRILVALSELRLFIYPDAAARRADGASLPSDRIPPDTLGGREGRVIATNNLIAIYYPRTELQLERVSNVLLARYTEDR